MKVCTKCGVEKELSEFSIKRGKPHCHCKQCVNEYSALRRKTSQTVKQYELSRRESKREYVKQYLRERYVPAPPRYKSSRIFVKKCKITGKLFIARNQKNNTSKEGLIQIATDRLLTFRNQPTEKQCVVCNNKYFGTHASLICHSKECKQTIKRINRAIGYAREKGATILHRIDPINVFSLHNWRCATCGCDTPESLKGTNHPSAPTLDHIIPLSRGGQHTMDNLQCLCRDCNTAKGDAQEEPSTLIVTRKMYYKLNKTIYEREKELRSV